MNLKGCVAVVVLQTSFTYADSSATAEKGNFTVMGEKLQTAANYTTEKLEKAGTFVADTAVSAKDKVVATARAAEHAAASAMRTAAEKIDPEKK